MEVDGIFFEQTAWPLVHSSMKPNASLSYYGTDTVEDFEKNKHRLPSDWVYQNKPISYKFNKHGLRMNKELDQVDSNYMVAFGCSHTLGVGVAIEDTWPFLMSKKLNIDYINLGVSGSSIKLNAINFFNMLEHSKTLPKLVAFAWPSSIRYTWYSQGQFLFYLPRFSSSKKEFKYITNAYENLLMSDALTTDAIFYRNMVKTTCDKLGISYCETGFDDRCEFVKSLNIQASTPVLSTTNINRIDLDSLNTLFARDIRDKVNDEIFAHIGIDDHQLAVDVLIKQLGKLND
jgi:hypothetical protein